MDRVQSGRPLEPAVRTSRRFGAPDHREQLAVAIAERRIARCIVAFVVTAALMALMAGVASPANATTPGSNGRIAFSLDKGSGYDLYTIKHDGTDLRKLIDLNGDAFGADWSPNGRRVVFDHNIKVGSNIAIMHADGSYFRDLTHTGYRGDPAFIPGRHRIVYACDCPKSNGLFVMRDDGTNRHRLTSNPFVHGSDTDPNVSPDGRTVTFVRVKKNEVLQALFAVNVNGSHLRKIVPYTSEVAIKHDWSPRGNRIVFTVDADSPGGVSPNVATIRPDGTGMRMLTHVHRDGVRALAGSYSPDGRWIVFKMVNINTGTYKLMKMHPDGSARMPIASLPASPFLIDWGSWPGA